jgi:AcrR family transcriptional regulator
MMPLSQDTVIAAGVQLVRAEGWSRLSVRALAAQLGVTPMALYRHVPSSEALQLSVISRIAGVCAEVRDSGDLLGDLAFWANRSYAALNPYPGAAAYLLTTWFEVSPTLLAIERLLEIVHSAGLEDFEAVAAVNAVFMYVLMRSEAEQTVRRAGTVKRSLQVAVVEGSLPRLSALMEHYTTARFDLHFEYGLQVLLDGIALRLMPPWTCSPKTRPG